MQHEYLDVAMQLLPLLLSLPLLCNTSIWTLLCNYCHCYCHCRCYATRVFGRCYTTIAIDIAIAVAMQHEYLDVAMQLLPLLLPLPSLCNTSIWTLLCNYCHCNCHCRCYATRVFGRCYATIAITIAIAVVMQLLPLLLLGTSSIMDVAMQLSPLLLPSPLLYNNCHYRYHVTIDITIVVAMQLLPLPLLCNYYYCRCYATIAIAVGIQQLPMPLLYKPDLQHTTYMYGVQHTAHSIHGTLTILHGMFAPDCRTIHARYTSSTRQIRRHRIAHHGIGDLLVSHCDPGRVMAPGFRGRS
jgi:hypothetical protein